MRISIGFGLIADAGVVIGRVGVAAGVVGAGVGEDGGDLFFGRGAGSVVVSHIELVIGGLVLNSFLLIIPIGWFADMILPDIAGVRWDGESKSDSWFHGFYCDKLLQEFSEEFLKKLAFCNTCANILHGAP